ncbi:hypothetical protein HDU93_009963 [Gonapodya sp. JEL0774]|nr:hypothetical protein HDU93_009963 [Gonapodya sp. JEL0774]
MSDDEKSDAGGDTHQDDNEEDFEPIVKTRSRRNRGDEADLEELAELPEEGGPDEDDAEMTDSEGESGSGSDEESGGEEAEIEEGDTGEERMDVDPEKTMKDEPTTIKDSKADIDNDDDDPVGGLSARRKLGRAKAARIESDGEDEDIKPAPERDTNSDGVSAAPSLKIKIKASSSVAPSRAESDDGAQSPRRDTKPKKGGDLEELFGSDSEEDEDLHKPRESDAFDVGENGDDLEQERDDEDDRGYADERRSERVPRENVEAEMDLVEVADIAGVEADGKKAPVFVINLPQSGSVAADPVPFEPATFFLPDDVDQQAISQQAESTIRWKYGKNNAGKTTTKDSNSRLVRWSDGSYTLLIGTLQFPLAPVAASTATSQTSFLLALHQGAGMFETVRSLPVAYQLRPPAGGAGAKGGMFIPRKKQTKGAVGPVSAARIKNISIDVDPVLMQEKAIKAQQEKEKLARRLERGRERAAGRYRRGAAALDEQMLEDDDMGYGGGGRRKPEERYEEDDNFIDDSSIIDGSDRDAGSAEGESSDSEGRDAEIIAAKRGKRSTEEILEESDEEDDVARKRKVRRVGRVDSDEED